MTDHMFIEHWDSFVQRVGLRGRIAFVHSGITIEELGEVVRVMEGSRSLNAPMGAGSWLFSVLGERFHKNDTSSEATLDVHKRRAHALYAAFATSLHLRSPHIRSWLEAALRLHLDRKSLFVFLLSTKFGIDANDIEPHLGHTVEAFEDWLRVFPPDLLAKKEC